MTTAWVLLVEENRGYQDRYWAPRILGRVDGTREEAMQVLRTEAERYKPRHPMTVRRRRLLRDSDGFLALMEGAVQDFHCRFSLTELVHDSDAPAPDRPWDGPDSAPEPPAPAAAAAAAAAGGVPAAADAPAGPDASAGPDAPADPDAWDTGVPAVPSWLGRDGASGPA